MKQTIIACIALVLVTGCGPARIALTGSAWENHESYAVKGRQGLMVNQKLQFGQFRTTQVKRSWTKGSDGYSGFGIGRYGTDEYLNIIGTQYIDRKQTLRFQLTNEHRDSSMVYCVSRFKARDLQIGDQNGLLGFAVDLLQIARQPDANVFYAQLYLDPSSRPWQLMLENDKLQRDPGSYSGWVGRSPSEYYTLAAVTQMLNKKGEVLQMPFGAMGIEIRDKQGRPMAAVNLADNGTVYFTRDLSPAEKFLMANICTALLLQEQIG